MKAYTIKHYEEGYEIEQERIHTIVAKTRIYPTVERAKQLQEEYSKDKFDPEMNSYCFNSEGKMVGFITSHILDKEDGILKANFTFPEVLPEYEETTDILFENAIKILRNKNVQIVQSSFGIWGGSIKWAQKWGFEKVDEIGVLYGIEIHSVNFNEENKDVHFFNPESDLDDIVKIFASKFNLPENDVRKFTLFLHKNQQTLAYIVIREKGKIVATGAIQRNQIASSIGMLNAMYDIGLKYLKSLLMKLLRIAKDQDIEKVFMFFTHLQPSDPIIKSYSELGFTLLASNINYEKDI